MNRKIARFAPLIFVPAVLVWMGMYASTVGQTQEPAPAKPANSISAFHGDKGSKMGSVMMGAKEITPEEAIPLELHKEAIRGNKAKLNLFYIGRRRSELEPCGCKIKQLGGVQYEASLYESLGDGAEIKLDSGEWASPQLVMRPENALKSTYLLRSFQLLDLDAVNVSLNGLAMGQGYFQNVEKQFPGVMARLISANIFKKDNPDELMFEPTRILTRKLADGTSVKIGIIGAASLVGDPITQQQVAMGQTPMPQNKEIEDFIVRDPIPFVQQAVKELRPQVDLLILLYAGLNDATLQIAESVDNIDYVITTGRMTPEALSGTFNGAKILEPTDVQGKVLSHMALEFKGDRQWAVTQETQNHDIYTGLPEAAKLASLIENFKARTQEFTVTRPARVEFIYAGASRCSMCHQDEYADWKQSAHSDAVATLVRVNQQYNPQCLECHVTGYRSENGFYSINDPQSRLMYDVQCEVCHGPGRVHADVEQKIKSGAERWMTPEQFAELQNESMAAMPPKAVPESVCSQCHTEDTTPEDWTYEHKVLLINHSGGADQVVQAE